MVVSGHSGPGADDKWNLLCFPNRFVVFTEFQKEWAHKFNPLVKIVKIANGVDLNKFNTNVKPVKIDLPHPIILSVGALEEGKRLDLIIKATATTKASLLLVGRGNLEKELQKLGDSLLKNRFKIMNFEYSEMPGVYRAADLFTYPTVPWESFGLVLVEAMASGLAVVATDDPIRREIVGNAGSYVNPQNTEEYVKTLEKALQIKWGSAPRKQAEKFSWDEITKRYKELFESLTKELYEY